MTTTIANAISTVPFTGREKEKLTICHWYGKEIQLPTIKSARTQQGQCHRAFLFPDGSKIETDGWNYYPVNH